MTTTEFVNNTQVIKAYDIIGQQYIAKTGKQPCLILHHCFNKNIITRESVGKIWRGKIAKISVKIGKLSCPVLLPQHCFLTKVANT